MTHGGPRIWLSRSAWLRAIVLMILSEASEPVSVPALCFRLMIDQDAVNAELRVLMEFGAVERRPAHARRWLYSPSKIVRLAAA